MPSFQLFSENRLGRDFVVGDLHGCRNLLEIRLKKIGFNFQNDRLFSVGDLIDKGPDSFATLSLIMEPWFFPVMGNHEDMFLHFMRLRHSTKSTVQDFIDNGGTWVRYLTESQQMYLAEVLLPKLLELPYLIRVEGKRPFNVVHAELVWPADQPYSLELLLNDDRLFQNRAYLTWSRKLVSRGKRLIANVKSRNNEVDEIPGPGLSDGSITYAGHTILRKPLQIEGNLFIDGGAHLQFQNPALNVGYLEGYAGRLIVVNHTDNSFV